MKSILLFSLILSTHALSQNSISIGPQIGLAANFSKSSKMGFGASVEYNNKFSERIGVRGTLGYNYFKGKYFDDYVSFIPVRVGIDAYLVPELFLFADVGIVAYNDSNNDSKSGFSFGFGAAHQIPLQNKQFIELSANYNYFRYSPPLNYTWFNIRAAYGLKWSKKPPTKEE